MEKIRIVTDSASDLPADLQSRYNIDVLSFPVIMGDKEYDSVQDFGNEGFYELMKQYDDIPKTSQITSFQFMEYYYNYYEQGYTDLILILINSQGSATYNNSLMAVDLLYDEHPECEGKIRIHCFDSGSYCSGYGHVALEAGRMLEEGASAEEIITYVGDSLPRRKIYFGIYDLKYAGKSGRIPSAAAFVGDKLGIKPIMKIWDHEILTAAKCRGEKKLVAKICHLVLEDMEPGTPYQIIYGDNPLPRDEMTEMMVKELGYGPTEYYQIGVVVAANAGPTVAGVSFIAKESWK